MFNFEMVYVVTDTTKKVRGVYKKRENAVASLPEGISTFPLEIGNGKWAFGSDSTNRWLVEEIKVGDSHDLSPAKSRRI